jgi:Phasin protein
MDYYFDHPKTSVASAPSGGTEFGEKVKTCADQNISATQEFVRELAYAKDIQDMLRIQVEFMRSQLEAFCEHGLCQSGLGITLRVMHAPYLSTISSGFRRPRKCSRQVKALYFHAS